MSDEPTDIQTNTPNVIPSEPEVFAIPNQTNSKLHVGDRFMDRYFLERSLGFGSFGQTWLAFDSVKNGNVVFKQLPSTNGDNPLGLQRLLDTIEDVQELHQRQHLVVQELIGPDSNGRHAIVSPYIDGIPLDDYYDNFISTFRMFPRSSVIRTLWPIAGVLDAAHTSALYHKNLKPQNILIGKTAGIKLTDFSVPTLVRTLYDIKLLETPDAIAYTAPEILHGKFHSRFSDQYSLAAIAYELICGKKSFLPGVSQTFSEAIIRGLFVPISTQPDDVNDILERALSRKPEDRFASCTEFLKTLMNALLTKELHSTKKRQQFHFGTKFGMKYGAVALLLGAKKPEVPEFLTNSRPEVIWPFDQQQLTSDGITGDDVENFVFDRDSAKSNTNANSFSSPKPANKVAAGITAASIVLGGLAYYCWPNSGEKPNEQEQAAKDDQANGNKKPDSNGLRKLNDLNNELNSPDDSFLADIFKAEQSVSVESPLEQFDDGDDLEQLGADSVYPELEKTQPLPPTPSTVIETQPGLRTPAPVVTAIPAKIPEPPRRVEPLGAVGLGNPSGVQLRELAERGNTAAQVRLALDLQQGTGGFAVAEVESVFWFRKAAIKHDSDAMYYLGRCYETGRGEKMDDVRAMQWYQKAAMKDHPQATYRAGLFYDQGRGGVRKNSAESFRLFRKAANLGSEEAKQQLR